MGQHFYRWMVDSDSPTITDAELDELSDIIPLGEYCDNDMYQQYYIDKRINSTTKGELYDSYPSDEGAQILNKSNYNFVTKDQIS